MLLTALTLSAAVAQTPSPDFDCLGAMIDCSRGRVLKVDYLKTLFPRMAKMGYTSVMLYTEDTYKLENHAKWGYLRGGYTAEDVKSIKAAADGAGIELVPCIQTLGHLEKPLKWPEFKPIANGGMLLIGEEATYALIDDMFDFWEKTVGGKRIHIGMDEAEGFAGGEYRKRHGERDKMDVFLEHLTRVESIAAKHGFTELIMWGDMFYKIISKTHDYYDPEVQADPSVSARIPKNVRLCFWDYYHDNQRLYEQLIDGHRALKENVVLAGGIWTWDRYFLDLEKTLANSKAFLDAARAKGCREMWFTLWGDDGAASIPDLALGGLFACAELAAGRTAEPTEENCARFKAITGYDYAENVRFGDVTRHYVNQYPESIFEKYILFDDPLSFGNYRNYLVRKNRPHTSSKPPWGPFATYKTAEWRDDGVAVMEDFRETLTSCAMLEGVPEAATALVKVLLGKVNLARDLLAAWRAKDRTALERLATRDLPALRSNFAAFAETYRADWYRTSHVFGFDLLQKRHATVAARLEEAERRLKEYLAGQIETIPELDEAMGDFGAHSGRRVFAW